MFIALFVTNYFFEYFSWARSTGLALPRRAAGVPFPSRWNARVERWTRLGTPMYSSGFNRFTLTGRGGGYTGRSEDGDSPKHARRSIRALRLGLNRVDAYLPVGEADGIKKKEEQEQKRQKTPHLAESFI